MTVWHFVVVSSKVETSDVEIEATILVFLKQKGWNVKHVLSSKNIFWQRYLEKKNMACFIFFHIDSKTVKNCKTNLLVATIDYILPFLMNGIAFGLWMDAVVREWLDQGFGFLIVWAFFAFLTPTGLLRWWWRRRRCSCSWSCSWLCGSPVVVSGLFCILLVVYLRRGKPCVLGGWGGQSLLWLCDLPQSLFKSPLIGYHDWWLISFDKTPVF